MAIENTNTSSCLFTIPQDTGSRIYIAAVTLVALSVILSIVAIAIKPSFLGNYSFVPITVTLPLLVGLVIGGYFLKKTESPLEPEAPPADPPPADPPMVVDAYTSIKALEAAAKGDLPKMRELLESGKPFDLSRTLGTAASSGHSELCALLLEKGADPRDQRNRCFKPMYLVFYCSCPKKQLETLRVFLKKDPALVSEKLGAWEKTPLHLAVTVCPLEKVKLLIEHRADVNAVDNEGNTPLHWVARSQVMIPNYHPDIETIEFLMQAGATLTTNKKGETFETLAQEYHSTWFNKPDIQERLKKCGAIS